MKSKKLIACLSILVLLCMTFQVCFASSTDVITEMVTNTVETEEAEGVVFNDIAFCWAKNDILALAEAKVVSGKEEGIFAPNDDITKAEFAALLVKGMNIPIIETYETAFADVPADEWYAKYANTLGYKAIVRKEGNFEPNSNIKLKDAVTMLYSLASDNPSINQNNYVETYKWYGYLTDYQKDAFAYALDNKLINKLFEYATFSPEREINRAEAATLVNKFRNHYGI